MIKEEEIKQEIIKKFGLKIITIFCIISLAMVGFSFAQQTSTTTVKKEFINPLPKDKFVFLEINEQIDTNAKWPPPIKYEIVPPSYFKNGKLYILNEEDIPMGNVFLVVFHYTSWSPAFMPRIYKISKLPFTIEFPLNLPFLNIKKDDWFGSSLIIKSINMEGVVELEYIKKGKNEKSILQKDKSWEKVLKENIWSPTMKYPMGEVYKFHKFKVSLQVVDHGVLDKCYNVNISKFS